MTRLRTKYQGQLPICAEAADEIVLWKDIATDLYEAWLEPTGDELPMRKALKRYKDAIQGDKQ